MTNRRSRRLRDLTRLVNAQARHSGAQARQTEAENVGARLRLEQQRHNDAVTRRERYVDLLNEQHVHNEIRAFNYLRLLTEIPTNKGH